MEAMSDRHLATLLLLAFGILRTSSPLINHSDVHLCKYLIQYNTVNRDI